MCSLFWSLLLSSASSFCTCNFQNYIIRSSGVVISSLAILLSLRFSLPSLNFSLYFHTVHDEDITVFFSELLLNLVSSVKVTFSSAWSQYTARNTVMDVHNCFTSSFVSHYHHGRRDNHFLISMFILSYSITLFSEF